MRAKHMPDYDHPLYNLIREIGADAFSVEPIEGTFEEQTAMELETHHIMATPENLRLNVSRGGYFDEIDGSRIGWEHINASEESREAYLKRLSETKMANDWTDYDKLSEASEQWRKEHPRKAYRNSFRAIRVARKGQHSERPEPKPETEEERKTRLMKRFKPHKARSEWVRKGWEGVSDEKREERARAVSAGQKRHFANLTTEERRAATAKARASVDRSKQGPAASAGLKRYWEELKKDPERYKAVMEARKRKKCEPTTS